MGDPKIKTYSVEELEQRILAEKENLRKLLFAHKISSIENPMRIKATRRTIAQLKTALTIKEIEK